MKRIVLIMAAALALTACSSAPSTQHETDAAGNMVTKSEYSNTVYPDQLPVDLPYNDKTLTVTDFKVYQDTVDYEHYLYAVVSIDATSLSDEDFHWLIEDAAIDASAFVKGGQNNLSESVMMDQLGRTNYTDLRKIKICWLEGIDDTYKKAFDGSDISLMVDVDQEEGNPWGIYYSFTPETIDTIDQMDEDEREFYEEKTAAKAEAIQKNIDNMKS